jgi:hypothetical protein
VKDRTAFAEVKSVDDLFADQEPAAPPKRKREPKPACPSCRIVGCKEPGGERCEGIRKWWAYQRQRLLAMLAEAAVDDGAAAR